MPAVLSGERQASGPLDAGKSPELGEHNTAQKVQHVGLGSSVGGDPHCFVAYFGEIMAGLVTEHFVSSGNGNWRVPAFLFPLHQLAFDQLEKWRELGSTPQPIFGQTGDDCVAFSQNESGRIVASLVCEGKCTHDHYASLIADAHRKISTPLARPVSISRLRGILRDRENDPEASQWAEALYELYHRKLESDYQRFDLVSYHT